MRWKYACVAILACLAAAMSVHAQVPAGGTLPEAKLTRQSAFQIPFRMTAAKPGQEPVEVQLYVSADMGKSWQLDSRVLPAQGSFNFRGQHDGEFWFIIRTVDAQGQLHPAGPTPPGMRVVIDTVSPSLELFADRGPGGEIRARWTAADDNLEPNSLKVEYQTGPNQPWQPVSIDPFRGPQPNVRAGAATFWPQPNTQGIVVRAQVADRAGNPTIAQINVDQPAQPDAPAGSIQPIQSAQPATTPTYPTTSAPLQTGVTPGSRVAIPTDSYGVGGSVLSNNQKWSATSAGKTPLVVDSPANRNGGMNGQTGVATASNTTPWSATPPSMPDRFPTDQRRDNSPFTPAAAERVISKSPGDGPVLGGASNQGAMLAANPASKFPPTAPAANRLVADERGPQLVASGSAPAAEIPPGEEPRRVNSTKFELAYDLDAATSAGATRVELYGTRDGGKTWAVNGTAVANSGTVSVRVDGEGTYGFRIAVQKANGATVAPRAGDLPEVWVVVDTTKPDAKLTSAELSTETPPGTLVIRWEASDAKLAPRPVSLFFAANKGGPWTTIASGLDNSSQYAWKLDRRVPDRVFLRLEVSDEAGNLTAVESADPVSLNPSQPSGRIRGVRSLSDDGAATRWQTWR